MAILIALLCLPFVSFQADAYPTRHHRGHSGHHYKHFHRSLAYQRSGDCTLTNDGRSICSGGYQAAASVLDPGGNRTFAMAAAAGSVIGSRPAGCPHRYCGCGLRKHLGISDVRLNLASNWARLLPHEGGPRPGLAAVRRGHVMYIEAAAGNGQWLIRDYNSGGGLSRMHVRDVRGYVFVNPRAQLASR
jgi:hypothetical protein